MTTSTTKIAPVFLNTLRRTKDTPQIFKAQLNLRPDNLASFKLKLEALNKDEKESKVQITKTIDLLQGHIFLVFNATAAQIFKLAELAEVNYIAMPGCAIPTIGFPKLPMPHV